MNKNLDKFANDVASLIEQYTIILAPYEVGYELIALSVNLLLNTSPNTMSAFDIIFAAIKEGKEHFKESKGKKNELK